MSPLLVVSKVAAKQISWIDRNQPEHQHSSQSARTRHSSASIFHNLSNQAEVRVKLRKVKRKSKPRQEMD
jgi:tRNA U34 2-thiouridine synthase MnmA/TrmU